MRRFSHGHSLLLGAVLALLIQHNGWLVLVGALLLFAAGIVAGRSWLGIKRGVNATGSLLAARVDTERERAGAIRATRRVRLAAARASRDKLDQAYKRGDIDGMDYKR